MFFITCVFDFIDILKNIYTKESGQLVREPQVKQPNDSSNNNTEDTYI